jgi:hypothetical protein
MSIENKIFSELEGFAIYEPTLLKEYLKDNNIVDNDLLSHLITSTHGDNITTEGIMIPIIGVPPDYYQFSIINVMPSHFFVESKGWVLKVQSGEINIVGIGYLKDISAINASNCLSLPIMRGWYQLSIISYMKLDTNELCFGLKLVNVSDKPVFYGDMSIDYRFQ